MATNDLRLRVRIGSDVETTMRSHAGTVGRSGREDEKSVQFLSQYRTGTNPTISHHSGDKHNARGIPHTPLDMLDMAFGNGLDDMLFDRLRYLPNGTLLSLYFFRTSGIDSAGPCHRRFSLEHFTLNVGKSKGSITPLLREHHC